MMWNTGMGPAPWMWLVMGGGTVVFWAAVVLAVRWAFGDRGVRLTSARPRDDAATGPAAPERGPHTSAGPLEVLQERLARGEIDVDEYARTRKALVEGDPALGRDRSRTPSG